MRPNLFAADGTCPDVAQAACSFVRVQVSTGSGPKRLGDGESETGVTEVEAWFPESPHFRAGDELADVEAYGREGNAFLFPRLRVSSVGTGQTPGIHLSAVSVGPFYQWDFRRARAEFFPG